MKVRVRELDNGKYVVEEKHFYGWCTAIYEGGYDKEFFTFNCAIKVAEKHKFKVNNSHKKRTWIV